MEFPLWGDKYFGAMEIYSPLHYQLALSDKDCQLHVADAKYTEGEVKTELVQADEPPPINRRTSRIEMPTPSESHTVCIKFEYRRICASISKDQERIFLSGGSRGI